MKVCNFCNKSEEDVKRIITATKGDICNNCILLCMDILIDELGGFREVKFDSIESNLKGEFSEN